MSDTIMAVDLGRFKCVVCRYRRSTREAVFRTIDTAGGAFEELFAEPPTPCCSSRRAPTPGGSTTWPSPAVSW